MARANEVIGEAACTCCGRDTPVKQMGNGLAVMTCPWCGTKTQAFTERGNALIRAKIKGQAAPAPAAAPAERKPNPATPGQKQGGGVFDTLNSLFA